MHGSSTSVRVVSSSEGTAIQELAQRVNQARCILVFAGAGISTDSGMPDFRSKDGLYRSGALGAQALLGAQVFDAAYLRPENAVAFYQTLLDIRSKAREAKPSQMHGLFKSWDDDGRLLRVYTQNIDGLEEEAGLSVVPLGSQSLELDDLSRLKPLQPHKGMVVQLHGSFRTLRFRCTICHRVQEMPEEFENKLRQMLAVKNVPRCKQCSVRGRGLPSRNATVGILKPDVVLFNEEHHNGAEIQRYMEADLRGAPDLLLIIGTRMDIVGVQSSIRSIARAMHDGQLGRRGEGVRPMVLFVNRDPIALGSWRGIIDVAIWVDCQTFVDSLRLEEQNEAAESRRQPYDQVASDGLGEDEETSSLDGSGVGGEAAMAWDSNREMEEVSEGWKRIMESLQKYRDAGLYEYD